MFRVEQGVVSNLRFSYEVLASPEFGELGDDEVVDVDTAAVIAIKQVYRAEGHV